MLRSLSSGLQLTASRRAPGEAKMGKDHQAALGSLRDSYSGASAGGGRAVEQGMVDQ